MCQALGVPWWMTHTWLQASLYSGSHKGDHTVYRWFQNSWVGAVVGCKGRKESNEREEWRLMPRFPVWVTKIGIWYHWQSGQPLWDERERCVVGCKCLWILRREVWAVALGLRDGWEWCLQSREFAGTSMGQATSDSGRFQGQGRLRLVWYLSWNGKLSYSYF